MAHILAVGGGKGGSGKSFVCANLGVMLAKKGKSVLLIDLDLGTPNLHTMVGVDNPNIGLNNFINKSTNDLSRTAIPTKIPNLYLISSTRCSLEVSNLYYVQKQKIIRAILQMPSDYVILDLGAGTTYNTLDFFLSAHRGITVFTPEPTSIQNTVQFIKAVYLRKLKHILKQDGFTRIMKKIGYETEDGAVRSPLDIVENIMQMEPEKARMLQRELRKRDFRLVLNQYRKQVDESLGKKIEKVCNRHFYSHFTFLGNIAYNERIFESIVAKSVFAEKYPYTPTCTDLKNITSKLTESAPYPSSQQEQHVQI